MDDQYKQLLQKLAELQNQELENKKGEFRQAYKEFHDPVMTEASGRTDVERFWNMGRTKGILADALKQDKIDPNFEDKFALQQIMKIPPEERQSKPFNPTDYEYPEETGGLAGHRYREMQRYKEMEPELSGWGETSPEDEEYNKQLAIKLVLQKLRGK